MWNFKVCNNFTYCIESAYKWLLRTVIISGSFQSVWTLDYWRCKIAVEETFKFHTCVTPNIRGVSFKYIKMHI